MRQIGIFPAGIHHSSVIHHHRIPVSILVESQPAESFGFRIIQREVTYLIPAAHTGYSLITDIRRGDDTSVRQIISIAEFDIRFVHFDFLVQVLTIDTDFIDLPTIFFIHRREKQTIGIPMHLQIGNIDIPLRFINRTDLQITT